MFKKILKNIRLKHVFLLVTGIITITALVAFTYDGCYFISAPQKTESKLTKIDSRPDEIKGKIITLKRLRPEYFEDYYKMISPKDVIDPLYLPKSHEGIIAHLNKQLKKENAKQVLLYMIFDNKDNKLIGSISIREKNDRDPGQYSCWINNKYWGQGRIQEAIKLISDAYFKLTGAKSFDAHVEMWNIRSYYGLKKAGFKLLKTYQPEKQHPRYILEFYNPNT